MSAGSSHAVDVLVVAEHDGATLNASTAKAVRCARELEPRRIDVAVFAAEEAIAQQAAALAGVSRVLAFLDPANGPQLAAVLAPQIAALAGDYTHVLAPSTTFGKDVMPRVAAQLNVGQVSDIMAVEGPYRFRRPIYAANAIVTVEASAEEVLVGTVRTASYAAVEPADPAPVEQREVAGKQLPAHTRWIDLQAGGGDRPDLQTAVRVVAGGRALGNAENFKLIYRLADVLNAAVGASRAAVDAGIVANDMQVGQTGKIIAPDLYIAVGISGAIQHLTGIKDAGTIVAINRDAEAPIFEIADVGLAADLFQAVPALIAALEKKV